MSRNHIVYFTEEEIKALANFCRVVMKKEGHTDYIQKLQSNGGKSGYDKLMEKVEEINGTKRE